MHLRYKTLQELHITRIDIPTRIYIKLRFSDIKYLLQI